MLVLIFANVIIEERKQMTGTDCRDSDPEFPLPDLRQGCLGAALKACTPEGAVVWSGIAYDEGCAATSLCTVMAFFCSDAHLDAWRESNRSGLPGTRLSLEEARQVGTALFGPMLAPAPSEDS